jgi:hypothetical protein
MKNIIELKKNTYWIWIHILNTGLFWLDTQICNYVRGVGSHYPYDALDLINCRRSPNQYNILQLILLIYSAPFTITE